MSSTWNNIYSYQSEISTLEPVSCGGLGGYTIFCALSRTTNNRQQTDLLSSEHQTQDLTLYTPSGSFQSLLVTEVAAGYRGKPECETLICISLYQLPTSKMSLISLVTVVSTAPTFNM